MRKFETVTAAFVILICASLSVLSEETQSSKSGIAFTINAETPLRGDKVLQLALSISPIEIAIVPNELLDDALWRSCAAVNTDYIELVRGMVWALNQNVPSSSTTSIDYVISGLPNPEPLLRIKVPFCTSINFEQMIVEAGDTFNTIFAKSQPANKPAQAVSAQSRADWNSRFIAANKHTSTVASAIYRDLKSKNALPDANFAKQRDDAFNAILSSTRGKTVLVPVGTINAIEIVTPVSFARFAKVELLLASFPPSQIQDKKNLSDPDWGKLEVESTVPCGTSKEEYEVKGKPRWLNIQSIGNVLEMNRKIREIANRDSRMIDDTKAPTLVIADSGLLGWNLYPFKDVILASTQRDDPPNTTFKHFNHGTQVASVVLGGPSFLGQGRPMKDYFSLNTKNVVKQHPQTGEWSVYRGKVNDAATDAATYADIVNLSVGFGEHVPGLPEEFVRANRTLFVFAAGNELKLGYPAGYGNSWTDGITTLQNTITVAGLASWGEPARQSYRDKNQVDIGALGCDVDVYNAVDPETNGFSVGKATGTSFAAPQVTFIAGLIKRELFTLSPVMLKRRLINSADIFLELERDVQDGRILNAEKALSVFLDVIHLSDDDSIHYGWVDLPPEMFRSCSDFRRPASHARKIRRRTDSDDERKYLIYLEDTESPIPRWTREYCAQLTGTVTFTEFKGETRSIPFNKIRDIVMRERSVNFSKELNPH